MFVFKGRCGKYSFVDCLLHEYKVALMLCKMGNLGCSLMSFKIVVDIVTK